MTIDARDLMWWRTPEGIATPRGLDRLVAFEGDVYEAFPLGSPPSDLRLLTRSNRNAESELLGDGPPNDDDEAIVRSLAWLPWTRVIGFRAAVLADNFLLGQSVQAQAYYAPAYMLHSLQLRMSEGLDVLELFMPPRDQVVLAAFSQSRSDEHGADPTYFDTYIDRATQFRSSFHKRQREVISKYLRLWVPWSYANRGKTGTKELQPILPALEKLIEYWLS